MGVGLLASEKWDKTVKLPEAYFVGGCPGCEHLTISTDGNTEDATERISEDCCRQIGPLKIHLWECDPLQIGLPDSQM